MSDGQLATNECTLEMILQGPQLSDLTFREGTLSPASAFQKSASCGNCWIANLLEGLSLESLIVLLRKLIEPYRGL